MSARKLVWVIVAIGIIGISVSCGKLQQMSEEAKTKAIEEEKEAGEGEPAPAPAPQQPVQLPAIPSEPSPMLAEEAQKVLVKKTEEFVYDPINRIDPFEPLKPQTATTEEKPIGKELPQSEYMGRYELRSLKLVAIVWGSVEPRAMFETPDGKAYSVKVGDLFSKDAAEVLSITPEGVLVQLAGRSLTGEAVMQKLMIKLKPEEQEREESESFLGFGAGSKNLRLNEGY